MGNREGPQGVTPMDFPVIDNVLLRQGQWRDFRYSGDFAAAPVSFADALADAAWSV